MTKVVLEDGATFEATREQTLDIFRLIRLSPGIDVREIIRGVLGE